MNEEQKAFVLKTENLTKEDVERAVHVTAHAKRAVDIFFQIPGSREEYQKDKEGFIKKWKIDLLPDDIDFLMFPKDAKEKSRILQENDLDSMPESFFRYRQYMLNKMYARDRMIDTYCVPSNARLKKWRERQMRRCDGALGGVNKAFIHAMVTIELAEGCSVGCEFCGLGAGRLKEIFRYTEENAELFKGVLRKLHEIIGDGAGYGMMYFATEPLDNPDYEFFQDAYQKEFSFIPQITTAACDRDLERTKKLVHQIMNGGGLIHRFTIRSEEMARKVFDFFEPEELALVELLPQYPEAPGFVPYVKAGKLCEDEERKNESNDPGTIVCVDGFRVNFPRRTITVITPCHADSKYPKGISESEPVTFEDAEDFGQKLNDIIEKYMIVELPGDEVLTIYDYFSVKNVDGKTALCSNYGEWYRISSEYIVHVIDMLKENKYDKHAIVKETSDMYQTPPENVYWILNDLWKKGIIKDKKFFE